MTTQETIERIKKDVHLPIAIQKYEETLVRNETNCYSHAIGATTPVLQIFRIGAISGEKSISEKYKSASEIIDLLKKDLDVLGLEYQIIGDDENETQNLEPNQYIVRLYFKIYADGRIWDYNFMRYEAGKWTEKWKGRKPTEIDANYYEKRWEWKRGISLKVTR